MVGDPAASSIELDACPNPRPAADLAVQIERHLLAIKKFDVQRDAAGLGRQPQPREALAAFDHRPHGHGLQPVEIRKPVGGGVISPAQPQRLQPFAHSSVGMGGLRLDPGANDIAHQAVHRRSDPWVVPRIPPGPPRSSGRARQDRRVQAVDGFGAFPAPPATGGVKAADAREFEQALEEGPHGWENRPFWNLKLLGMFVSIRRSCCFLLWTNRPNWRRRQTR